MSFSAQPHAAPIKLEGFDIPGSSAAPSPHAFSVDPAHLYGGAFGSQRVSSAPFYGGGSGAGFSDLDLDFETTLASLAQHGQHGANPFNPGSSQHSFGAAGSNGFLGNSNNFEQFGFHRIDKQQPQQHPPPPTSYPAGQQPPHTAASSLPPYLASSTSNAPSLPPFGAPPSPHDSRSPSVVLSPQAMDLFGNVVSPAPVSQDSPGGEFGSYSSVGDSFAQNQASQLSTSSSTSTSRRRQSPPEQPSEQRGRATSRSKSSGSANGVGKAPPSRVRSRSARRNATGAAYQAMGTGGAAQQATAAASASSAASSSSAIGIPGTSSTSSAPNHHHPLAMSMPAYTNGGAGAGMPASWYASGQALGLGGTSATVGDLDPTGWKPSEEQKGPGLVPASAPTLGAAKKGKAALDDVPEDATSKQAALLTEKRRKRRESHNAVERRRRDNINDRITELASLLPEILLEQASNGNEDVPGSPGTPLTAMLSPAPGTIPLPALGTSPATPTLLAGAHMAQGAGAAAAAAAKPNKGIILAKSVEYIRYLQQLVELHAQRNTELERLIHELRINPSAGGASYPQQGGPGSTTSFETSSGMNSGAGTSDARSPAEGNQHMSASMASSHFGDPNFNENFMNAAASGGFADGGNWGILTTPKEEDMDES
ncbi:helix-loop-helix DNA-binding domain-domain-containing protein [Leucosporidium creatinivorum]|uniref:Helix-loop-helix DNA-binding domain-domain-containing protein n=1 Tax=Leucosporidium creatinivorum TaxID=106004 RepID=A0A1Y2ENF1_9BASI|nr:helix-loop-helix DNA-binding domain-domain-containing protein [Leucosporidium creatinivorum]